MTERVESTKTVLTSTQARAATSGKGRILQVLSLSTVMAIAAMIVSYYFFFA
jgi:hypothetical protein